MASQTPILQLAGVTRNFGGLQALKDVNLRIEQGDLRGIIGPNGAGKITLFNVITGEFKSSSGKVYLRGEDISGLPPYTICRRGLSWTFQLTRIFPEMTVYDSIWAGANSKASRPWNPVSSARHLKHIEKETLEICKLIGLEDKKGELAVNLSYGDQKVLENVFSLFPVLKERLKQKAETLSGGEQQSLAIGRALLTQPDILVLDEPTTGLMPIIVSNLKDILRRLNSSGMTILLVEEEVPFALSLADRLYFMTKGKVVCSDTRHNLEGK
jgi:ABC-type branched-subunit amino acid transport system ATPase component